MMLCVLGAGFGVLGDGCGGLCVLGAGCGGSVLGVGWGELDALEVGCGGLVVLGAGCGGLGEGIGGRTGIPNPGRLPGGWVAGRVAIIALALKITTNTMAYIVNMCI